MLVRYLLVRYLLTKQNLSPRHVSISATGSGSPAGAATSTASGRAVMIDSAVTHDKKIGKEATRLEGCATGSVEEVLGSSTWPTSVPVR